MFSRVIISLAPLGVIAIETDADKPQISMPDLHKLPKVDLSKMPKIDLDRMPKMDMHKIPHVDMAQVNHGIAQVKQGMDHAHKEIEKLPLDNAKNSLNKVNAAVTKEAKAVVNQAIHHGNKKHKKIGYEGSGSGGGYEGSGSESEGSAAGGQDTEPQGQSDGGSSANGNSGGAPASSSSSAGNDTGKADSSESAATTTIKSGENGAGVNSAVLAFALVALRQMF